MHPISRTFLTLTVLVLTACASSQHSSSESGNSQSAKSSDSSGKDKAQEIIGTAAPDSKFSKLKIGMDMSEVQEIMGSAPDKFHAYESGKRWIPFYFGNDARRLEALYKGQGCLTFAHGNVWGAAGGELLRIHHDVSGNCYQP